MAATETPPLARGIRGFFRFQLEDDGNTPACAGNTHGAKDRRQSPRKHPRLRGEYYAGLRSVGAGLETPPLARGIRREARRRQAVRGNTPACAGNTCFRSGDLRRNRKHPRLRGEYTSSMLSQTLLLETPPLARGIRREPIGALQGSGNTPACAGNTRSEGRSTAHPRKHPRLRGEYYRYFPGTVTGKETPPLARGIRDRASARSDSAGNTPACAGNTAFWMMNINAL